MNLDIMTIRDMVFYGYHGVYPEENKLGQRFVIQMQGSYDASAAAAFDDLSQTANYGTIYKVIQNIVETKRFQLLETLAETVAQTLLAEFPVFFDVTIEVVKPQPPIPGFTGDVSVRIKRMRNR